QPESFHQYLLQVFKRSNSNSILVYLPPSCRELVEEIELFEQSGLPIMRPNSMNNYGVVLDELNFGPFFDSLRSYLQPMCAALYGDIGKNLDSQHAFIVQYKLTEDTDLGFHYDESEVTLNVCLG